MKKKIVLNEKDIQGILEREAKKILELEDFPLAVVGIQTRGVPLGKRLQDLLQKLSNKEVPFGFIDITFYRDDLSRINFFPIVKGSKLDFPIDEITVILVDDVLYTGRTVRAALDELMDYGRPRKVRLFVLVDRGLRELPIQADYLGISLNTHQGEIVEVRLKEVDGVDEVLVLEREDQNVFENL